MTKPRLVKVRALFYVFQQIIKKEAAPILTQPLVSILIINVVMIPWSIRRQIASITTPFNISGDLTKHIYSKRVVER